MEKVRSLLDTGHVCAKDILRSNDKKKRKIGGKRKKMAWQEIKNTGNFWNPKVRGEEIEGVLKSKTPGKFGNQFLIVKNDACYVGHVGDSRIYLKSDGKLNRITKDHSFVQTFVSQ
jgi:serine/threonine protein phosphatase PrpC